MYLRTTATEKILKLKKRIRAVSGGTSASKTFSIMMWLIDYCQSTPNEVVSVVAETLPHLKKGSMRDFLNIMQNHNYFDDKSWNKSDYTYTFPNRTKLEFFSADQPNKVRGLRRDVLFINECNNIEFETFNQLEVRTKKIIWLDWNPTHEHWFYTEVLPNFDPDFITLTYKDNEALDEQIVRSIEARKYDKYWWQVYGLGQLGVAEERIYSNWQMIDDIPHEAKLERYGVDFGYTNDPTAIVAVYYYNGGFILDEVAYQKGLSNKEIADILKIVPKAIVMADSAEPKSIDEIKSYGILMLPAAKGRGSVNQGIQFVQSQKISITKQSTNIIKDYRNYLWLKDKDGKVLNEPSHLFSHGMDAVRYALDTFKQKAPVPQATITKINDDPYSSPRATPQPFVGYDYAQRGIL